MAGSATVVKVRGRVHVTNSGGSILREAIDATVENLSLLFQELSLLQLLRTVVTELRTTCDIMPWSLERHKRVAVTVAEVSLVVAGIAVAACWRSGLQRLCWPPWTDFGLRCIRMRRRADSCTGGDAKMNGRRALRRLRGHFTWC